MATRDLLVLGMGVPQEGPLFSPKPTAEGARRQRERRQTRASLEARPHTGAPILTLL